MDDPDNHESLNRSEMALYDILKSWVILGKVMGAIVILIGSIASALEYENRLLGAVIGFAVSSFAVAMIQLLLLGLPSGLLGGGPLGAIVGALVAFFKPAILNKLISPDNPSNLNAMLSSQISRGVPNQLLIGAVVGACGGALLIGGLRAHGLIEDGVAWWPFTVYKRALERFGKSVIQKVLPSRRPECLSPQSSVETEEKKEVNKDSRISS